MSTNAKFEAQPAIDGTVEVTFRQWRYFIEYVHQVMSEHEQFIWRGQRDSDWVLETTLDRLIKNKEFTNFQREVFILRHLDNFKYAARGRRGPNPAKIESENEWWALGQHYGLSTPLLDWTRSPFVAAYFAFISARRSTSDYRAIYALYQPDIWGRVGKIENEEERKLEKRKQEAEKDNNFVMAALCSQDVCPEVSFISPFYEDNQRIVCQNGLFSRAPDGVNLDDWVTKSFKEEETGTLIKFLVPDSDRIDCLRTLNRMNINHLTLFPDLYGASKYCNLHGEVDNY
jgi:hypothetical protein